MYERHLPDLNACSNERHTLQSQAIKTPSAIYCSGQIPLDAEGNFIQGTIQEKTGQCIKNLKSVLTAAGSSIEKVVKVNIFLADMGSFAVRPRTKFIESNVRL